MKKLVILFFCPFFFLSAVAQEVIEDDNHVIIVQENKREQKVSKERLKKELKEMKKELKKISKDLKNSPKLNNLKEELDQTNLNLDQIMKETMKALESVDWEQQFEYAHEVMSEAFQTIDSDFNYSFYVKRDTTSTPSVFEQKVNSSIKKVQIQGLNGNLLVRTHNENTIKLKTYDRISIPKKAAGLRSLNNIGTDNTGLGIGIKEGSNEIVLEGIIRKAKSAKFEIWIPKRLAISFSNSNHSRAVKFVNIDQDLAINAGGRIELDEVTGPITAKVRFGGVMASFKKINQEKPISITCTHGDIDLSVPSNSKIDLDLKANWGEAFTDLNLDIIQNEMHGNESGNYSSSKLRATLNGGGVKMVLRGNHGNIYLRKKK